MLDASIKERLQTGGLEVPFEIPGKPAQRRNDPAANEAVSALLCHGKKSGNSVMCYMLTSRRSEVIVDLIRVHVSRRQHIFKEVLQASQVCQAR